MTWELGPQPRIDALMVGGHDLGATRQLDRAPGADGPYMPVHRAWEHPENPTVASAHHQSIACTHTWKVTSQRQLGMWCRCEKCGATKEETWD